MQPNVTYVWQKNDEDVICTIVYKYIFFLKVNLHQLQSFSLKKTVNRQTSTSNVGNYRAFLQIYMKFTKNSVNKELVRYDYEPLREP